MPKAEKVELIPAHLWICPDCGRDNYERCVTADMDPEERAAALAEFGYQPWSEVVFLTDPKFVQCSHCRGEFQTLSFGDEDENEEGTERDA